MANDIDMWKDIEEMEKDGESRKLWNLMDCYIFRYQEGNNKKAEEMKQIFIERYGYWGNWY